MPAIFIPGWSVHFSWGARKNQCYTQPRLHCGVQATFTRSVLELLDVCSVSLIVFVCWWSPKPIFTLTRQKKSWFFEPSMSSGSLDDEIYTINMIAYTLAEFSRYPGDQLLHLLIWNCSGHFHRDDYPFMRQMIDMALKLVEDSFDEELFVKVMCGQHFSAIVTTIFIAKNTITM